jgi:hypothetical protein
VAPASATERIFKWFSVGIFSRFVVVRFFLAHLDEVSLELESEKDPDPILSFEVVVRNEVGIFRFGMMEWFVCASPAGVLVFCPASLTESSFKEFVDVWVAVAMGIDVDGAERWDRTEGQVPGCQSHRQQKISNKQPKQRKLHPRLTTRP